MAAEKIYAYLSAPSCIEATARHNPPIRPTLDDLLEQVTKDQLRAVFADRIDAFSTLVLADYMQGPHSDLHLYLYKNFKDKIHTGARECIIAPRSGSKSTLMTLALPLWAICHNIYHFVVIASDTADQAEDFLTWIKDELENNSVIEELYPDAFGVGNVWRNDRIVTKNKILLRAVGSGGKMRGRRWGRYRVECVLLDDVENRQMIASATLRNGLITWFDQDVCKTGARAQDLDIFVAGTILHKDSLLNSLYEDDKYSSWNTVKYQSVISWAEDQEHWAIWRTIITNRYNKLRQFDAMNYFLLHKEMMLEGTEILWRDWDTYYQLMVEMVTDGELAFYRERQNVPVSPNEQIFNINKLFYYTEEEFSALDPSSLLHVLYLDSSLGKATTKNDFSSLIYLVKHIPTGYIFIRSISKKKHSVTKQIEEIISLLKRGEIHRVGVEANAFQILIGDELKKEIINNRLQVKVISIQHNVDKHARIESLEPYTSNGTIRFRTHGLEDLISEMQWYPFGHDDGLDSLEGGYCMLNTNSFKPTYAIAQRTAIPDLYVDTYSKRFKSYAHFRHD